ncbi:MAG TPA: bifunctional [glutamine synthetase] adenylyltransferase/[glutamine synthetase]-adenylyl-L-tyrosine phosphorylase [Stellaceae bacterium]|nr:bifunctional [glutamine synthetase] adenylyltransferase/[glutamine synthetase]-adenylyl-L-tyrosine phosphorylase [Stellaceae bacterium]
MPVPFSSLSVFEALPSPADESAAAIGLARWREAADDASDATLAEAMRALAQDTAGARLLLSVFGNSPYLTQTCLKEPGFVIRLAEQGLDATFAEILDGLNHEVASLPARAAVMTALRVAKRRAALTIALADLAGRWELSQVTGALSEFAECALDIVVRHLLASAAASGEIATEAIEQSGLIVLGMGKLGAHELNYSSDIDLIVLFDGERTDYRGTRGVQAFFTQIAQELVRMMAERTADGYVFRTDLRLRPDPGSTPPAVATRAALTYYESAGQNWERAAFIKARPVAGDRDAALAFLGELRPFLWRKNLDFAAIEDIHSIKRQINAHRGGGRIAVAGHDIKLGRGGIREIEFFAQTQQLIWGGRKPELRRAGTIEALDALAAAGLIGDDARDALTVAYHFLRKLEHRLQMIDDAQTHSVPSDPAALHRVAVLMGFADATLFAEALTAQLSAVEAFYARLFEEAPSLAAPGNLVFTGTEDDPETLKTLRDLGFSDPAAIAAIIRNWHHGRYRATRSARARELLTELVPGLVAAFGATPNPDSAFMRFDEFLGRLPAGVPFFSLFYNNPGILSLVAEIMGAGTRLAETVAKRPALLDAVLTANFFDPPPPRRELVAELEAMLDRAAHYEELLDLARRWVSDHKFQVGVQLLRHRLDGEAAGAAYADIAETALAALLPRVTADFAKSHGALKGGAMVVVALGKLGSREMTPTSDLDVVLIYDCDEDAEQSDGQRPLPPPAYYARLTQRYINALTTLTSEGSLYEVDMRLRPSGTSGPLATSLSAFRRYHDEAAWTWEQMALTRARLIAGPKPLADQVTSMIAEVLKRPREPAKLALEVNDMRERIADEHRNTAIWDVKHARGGLVDIEFIVQFLQLRDAAAKPKLLEVNTLSALKKLMAGGSLARDAADDLIGALAIWRDVQGLVKLTAEEPFDEDAATPALKALLAAGADAVDFPTLKEKMRAAAQQAFARYTEIIVQPAAAAARDKTAASAS